MEKLLQNRTLMMSTIGEDQMPAISYTPFVKLENKFYIFISEVANHYHNLIANPHVAVLIIEDEAAAKLAHNRSRVSFNCVAKKLEVVNEAAWQLFNERFNEKMMNALKGMDFDMFELDIKSGRLTKGFGKSLDFEVVEGELVFKPVTIDHKKRNI